MIATCIYCGFKIEHGIRHGATRDDAHQALIDHDRQCPKNPLVKELNALVEKRDSLSAELDEIIRDYETERYHRQAAERSEQALAAHVERLAALWAAFLEAGDNKDGAAWDLQEAFQCPPETSLAQREARVAAEADKKGFIAGCVYAASMLYPYESVGVAEMLKAATTEHELSLGSEYDLKRLIESKASGDIPGLHRAWQAAKRREQSDGGTK